MNHAGDRFSRDRTVSDGFVPDDPYAFVRVVGVGACLSVLDLEFFGIGLEYAQAHAQVTGQVIAPHRNDPGVGDVAMSVKGKVGHPCA